MNKRLGIRRMTVIAYIFIALCFACCIWTTLHLIKHPQDMKIMNIVWPITCLYAGPLAVWAYYSFDRKNMTSQKPFWQTVIKGTLHCGSGCTLGDLLVSVLFLVNPVTILGSVLLGDWTMEYIAAFVIGIIFQYYAIKPMKQLPAMKAFGAAFKADALSLTLWQVGMYGWMAISNFLLFHRQLKGNEPVYWLMMDIGMVCGLITAYPINWWLIKKGIKEAM